MNVKEIKKDMDSVTGRVKTGRLAAHIIIDYEKLKDVDNYELAEKLGLKPNVTPQIAKAKAIAVQLKEMGWPLQKS